MKSNIVFIIHVQKLPNVPLQFCFIVIFFGSIVGVGRYVFGLESFFVWLRSKRTFQCPSMFVRELNMQYRLFR